MATKTVSTSTKERNERDVMPLVRWMTIAAWMLLGVGLILSLLHINYFTDHNATLMVGIGFMVGSVFIYMIRTAIHLVHSGVNWRE